jgi:hypothetical protein
MGVSGGHTPTEINSERGDGEYNVRISYYDGLFTCRGCKHMLSSPVYEVTPSTLRHHMLCCMFHHLFGCLCI